MTCGDYSKFSRTRQLFSSRAQGVTVKENTNWIFTILILRFRGTNRGAPLKNRRIPLKATSTLYSLVKGKRIVPFVLNAWFCKLISLSLQYFIWAKVDSSLPLWRVWDNSLASTSLLTPNFFAQIPQKLWSILAIPTKILCPLKDQLQSKTLSLQAPLSILIWNQALIANLSGN